MNTNKRKIRTQIGLSAGFDFEEKTWTFEMPDDFQVTGGTFAIMPYDLYNEMTLELLRLKNIEAGIVDANIDLNEN